MKEVRGGSIVDGDGKKEKKRREGLNYVSEGDEGGKVVGRKGELKNTHYCCHQNWCGKDKQAEERR